MNKDNLIGLVLGVAATIALLFVAWVTQKLLFECYIQYYYGLSGETDSIILCWTERLQALHGYSWMWYLFAISLGASTIAQTLGRISLKTHLVLISAILLMFIICASSTILVALKIWIGTYGKIY